MCRNTSGCLPYLIIKGIMDSGKKKFDPRSIDEKAILDIVARKGTIRPDSPATSASPKPEDTVEEIAGSSEAPVFTTGEIDAYRASFLNTVRTKSRKSLHIDAGLHRRQKHDAEHVREWVVGAALNFEQGVGVFLQRQIARAQDREHGRSVCG